MIKIELVYAPLGKATVHLTLDLAPGARVKEALIASGIYEICPETQNMPVGIYAKQVSPNALLKEGDRIEIYRPLLVDPKEKRRQRAGSRRK